MQEPHPLANLTRSYSRLSSRFQRRKIKNLSRCRGARDEAKKGTEKKKKHFALLSYAAFFMRAGRPFASLIAPRRFHEFIGSCPICFEPIHEAADLHFFAPPPLEGSLSTKIVFPPIHRERQRGGGEGERERR